MSTKGKVAVIGMGYVGIPAAALLANAGYDVTGIQRRSRRSGWKIDWLNDGRCPIGGNEPELPEVLQRVVAAGRFRVTDDIAVLRGMDIILIDVQTGIGEDHIPRYEALREACRQAGPHLKQGALVILESTVGPGTTLNVVRPILEQESGLSAGLPGGFGLSFSYERVMAGRLVHNIRNYPKIVGGLDQASTKAAMEMYGSIVRAGVHGADITTAEVAKTVENAYRDVQIAFSNEVAVMCESIGVDVYEVRNLVNGLPNDPTSPRANPLRQMHFPGAGVGGHCLPKDTWLLVHGCSTSATNGHSCPASVLLGARRINDWMPVHMADLLEAAMKEDGGTLKGSTVAVLGYAFLENSDDPRNSPTITFLEELDRRGAGYKVHDPLVRQSEEHAVIDDLNAVLAGSDALVLMTAHDDYQAIGPSLLKELMKGRAIVDGRNVLDGQAFTAEGFVFKGVGKGNIGARQGVEASLT